MLLFWRMYESNLTFDILTTRTMKCTVFLGVTSTSLWTLVPKLRQNSARSHSILFQGTAFLTILSLFPSSPLLCFLLSHSYLPYSLLITILSSYMYTVNYMNVSSRSDWVEEGLQNVSLNSYGHAYNVNIN